jgi:hypothetical protein
LVLRQNQNAENGYMYKILTKRNEMKKFITALMLISSVSALANEKKVLCIARVNGSEVKTIQADLNESNSRIDFGVINGLLISANSDSKSSLITLSMVDIQTRKYFGSHGSLGKNGEGIVLSISNNDKTTDIICVSRQQQL